MQEERPMGEPKATASCDSRELAQKMSATVDAKDLVRCKINFGNNDVPQYLRALQRFEQESREANIIVK